mmetsp:Transcript_12071/g.30741  ORF Transcript_12071/g.30741 Transcript_12071/m.30741 type:complete len:89 (-) Transcript_12071:770-1036(-)
MCMQPWYFSIGRLHFGQGFEFARIQLRFSDSAEFLIIHFLLIAQLTGRWHSSPQLKQNSNPQEHATLREELLASKHSTALVQPGAGHH